MTFGHMEDARRWEIEEVVLRYRSHAKACEMNALASNDPLLNQMNRQRAKVWHARADEQAAKLKAYDESRQG